MTRWQSWITSGHAIFWVVSMLDFTFCFFKALLPLLLSFKKKTLESLYAPFKFAKFIFFFKTLEIGKCLGFKCQPLFSPQISLNNEPRALESVSLIAYLWRSISWFSSTWQDRVTWQLYGDFFQIKRTFVNDLPSPCPSSSQLSDRIR